MKQKILSTQNRRKDSHSGSVFGQYKEILLSKLDKQTGKQKGSALQNIHSQQFNLLILNIMIADGQFDQKFENQQTQAIQQAAPRPLSNLFILKWNEIGLSILFEVGIHKNHIIEGYEQLVGFEMNHKITFIDIRNDSQQSQLVSTAQQYVKQIQRNPYRSDLPLIRQEQVIIPEIKQSAYLDSLLYKFEDQNWGQLVFGEAGKVKRWIPYEFPKFRLKQKQIEKFQWEDNKFISQEWLNIKTMNKNFIKCNQINKALFQKIRRFQISIQNYRFPAYSYIIQDQTIGLRKRIDRRNRKHNGDRKVWNRQNYLCDIKVVFHAIIIKIQSKNNRIKIKDIQTFIK
ncbi:hypothetical protein pb186bvf_017216 [Paramecium bursaria]